MADTFKSAPASPRLAAALARLDSLVDWERWERFRGSQVCMRVDLEPARDLMRRLEHPERAFRHVHVAGTKGKGSCAALIAAGLRRAGLATGVYASPHVERISERIVLDGAPIADEALAEALEQVLAVRAAALQEGTGAVAATWFDVLTAAAFCALRSAGVAWAVVECGLGGRLDSTNVLAPGPCLITNIDLEHTALLGSTRAAIAGEKAGIVKPGGLVVSGVGPPGDEAQEVVRARALAVGAELVAVPPEAGLALEERNARLAGAVLDALGRDPLATRCVEPPGAEGQVRRVGAWLLDERTRRAARLPGRLEPLESRGTLFVLDGAHVAGSLRDVVAELARGARTQAPPVVVFGTGREKDAERLLKVLVGRVDRVLCTTAGKGPYRSPEELLEVALRVGLRAEAPGTPESAIARARELSAPDGWVLVTGSLHLVGAIRPLLRDG